jgi:hypothetical protein
MRPLFRALVTASVLSLAALAGSSPTTFAASDKAAAPWKYDFAWDYCWDGGTTDYCFDMKGRMVVTEFPDGSSFATITSRQTTRIFEDGVLVGTVSENELDRSVFDGFGEVSLQSVAHTNSTYEGEKCVITTVLKKVDFDIVLNHWNGPGCN